MVVGGSLLWRSQFSTFQGNLVGRFYGELPEAWSNQHSLRGNSAELHLCNGLLQPDGCHLGPCRFAFCESVRPKVKAQSKRQVAREPSVTAPMPSSHGKPKAIWTSPQNSPLSASNCFRGALPRAGQEMPRGRRRRRPGAV